MAVGTLHGTTVAWTTSTTLNALKVMDVRGINRTCEDVETTHMGTTVTKTFQPSDLKDEGEFVIVYQYDPAVDITVGAAAETLTIDWGGTGNTSVGSAYRKGTGPVQVTAAASELATIEVTCRCAGTWVHAG